MSGGEFAPMEGLRPDTADGASLATPTGPQRPFDRKMPPVIGLCMAALTLAIIGGVLIASQIGTEPSLTLPRVLVVIALVVEVTAVAIMIRVRPFAWGLFRRVFGVALCAYVVQSGIIGWTFVKNDVPAAPFIVLTGGLVVFATIVPLMIAFTVARYQVVE